MILESSNKKFFAHCALYSTGKRNNPFTDKKQVQIKSAKKEWTFLAVAY